MALTPEQIKERLGARYPWPLWDQTIPTVFDDCCSWEQQVLWLYRFILGVYLELQAEGYILIDEVLEDSPAGVRSSGIWKFVMKGLADLEETLRKAIEDGDRKTAQDAADALQQAVDMLKKMIADLDASVTERLETFEKEMLEKFEEFREEILGLIKDLQDRLDSLEQLIARMHIEVIRGSDRLFTLEIGVGGNSVIPYYPTASAMPNILSDSVVLERGNNCLIISDGSFEIYGITTNSIPQQYYAVLSFVYGENSRASDIITTGVYVHVLGTDRKVSITVPEGIFPDIDNTKYLAVWHPYYNPPR